MRKRGRPRNSTQSPEDRKRQLQKLKTKVRSDGNLEKTLDIDSDPESTPLRRGIRNSRIKEERGSNSEQEQKYIKIDSDTDSHAASVRSRVGRFIHHINTEHQLIKMLRLYPIITAHYSSKVLSTNTREFLVSASKQLVSLKESSATVTITRLYLSIILSP
jgi:hypothetical protein